MVNYKIIFDENYHHGDNRRLNFEENYHNSDNKTITCVILVILIIFVIICLWYLYRGSLNNSKNSFAVSAKAIRDFEIINDIFKNSKDSTYSNIKSQISDMDAVKYNLINKEFKKGILSAEYIDKL